MCCLLPVSPSFTVTDPRQGSSSRATRRWNACSAKCHDVTDARRTCLCYSCLLLSAQHTQHRLSNLLCNSDPADSEACYTKPKGSSDTPGYQCETVPREQLPHATTSRHGRHNGCFPLSTATASAPAGSVCCKSAQACMFACVDAYSSLRLLQFLRNCCACGAAVNGGYKFLFLLGLCTVFGAMVFVNGL